MRNQHETRDPHIFLTNKVPCVGPNYTVNSVVFPVKVAEVYNVPCCLPEWETSSRSLDLENRESLFQ
jgi:hypothetical protein